MEKNGVMVWLLFLGLAKIQLSKKNSISKSVWVFTKYN